MKCRLAHITDLHWRKAIPGSSGDLNRQSRIMPEAFKDALFKMKSQGVDLVAITGDLVDVPEIKLSPKELFEVKADYQDIKKELDESGLIYVCLPGNHDHLESFYEVFGTKRVKEHADYEFISFHDHAPWPNDVFRENEDLQTFEKVLSQPGPRNQIHLQHYLIYDESMKGECHIYGEPEKGFDEARRERVHGSMVNHANTDSPKILSMLHESPRPALVLSGHYHSGLQLMKKGDLSFHASPSFSENNHAYTLIDLNESEVSSQFCDLSEEVSRSSINSPYLRRGNWFKGGLHTHCKESSGCSNTPLTKGVEMYARKDFDFMAITDHDKITDLTQSKEEHPDIVFFEGFEHSVSNHMLFISESMKPYYEIEDKREALKDAQKELTIICHPQGPKKDYWTVEELKAYPILPDGVEVFNGHYGAPGWRMAGAGWDYTDFWVQCLDSNMPLLAFANDDYHEHDKDFGNGWNQVFAQEKSSEAILSALKAGSTYATTGLFIHSLHEYRGQISISFKDEVKGTFYGPGHTVLSSTRSTSFDFQHSDETYIRFEAESNGRKCWTQAFFAK